MYVLFERTPPVWLLFLKGLFFFLLKHLADVVWTVAGLLFIPPSPCTVFWTRATCFSPFLLSPSKKLSPPFVSSLVSRLANFFRCCACPLPLHTAAPPLSRPPLDPTDSGFFPQPSHGYAQNGFPLTPLFLFSRENHSFSPSSFIPGGFPLFSQIIDLLVCAPFSSRCRLESVSWSPLFPPGDSPRPDIF